MFDEFEEINCPAKLKILFVGAGNLLQSDNGVGIDICKKIQTNDIVTTQIIQGGFENYIESINQSAPDLIILIDCVDFRKMPGYFALVPAKKFFDEFEGTKNVPLKNILNRLHKPLWILGIQPALTTAGKGLSPRVKKASDYMSDIINQWTRVNYMPLKTEALADLNFHDN